MLVIGTMCTMHAFYDCMHDVLCNKIDNQQQGQSDAVMFANEICGTARCWGLIWTAIAFLAIGLAVFGLIALGSECDNGSIPPIITTTTIVPPRPTPVPPFNLRMGDVGERMNLGF
eukprot:Trichotokara_eunicae@DN6040_c0_g1_i2.p1